MAKPRTPNQKKRYKALNKRLNKYMERVRSIFGAIAAQTANVVTTATNYPSNPTQPFRFSDYPNTQRSAKSLLDFFVNSMQAVILTGTSAEWKQSNLVQDLLADDALHSYRAEIRGIPVERYYEPNNEAYKAFLARKDKGLSLSDKVWGLSKDLKSEMECVISAAIEKGQSAVTLSKKISKYLQDFDSMQKDYKEKFGQAADCKNCEYRSIRLARSEINMAYRTAEQERWRQMDFIKGYEIKLSHSHPKPDICDELVGVYPKWFVWTGWHPNCMDYCVPIVMTDDEWYSGKGKEITELPDNFTAWFHDNGERIMKAKERGTLPYWITDNESELQEQIKVAKQSAEGIQMSRNAKKVVDTVLGKERMPEYSPEQIENHKEVEKILKTKKKPYMSFKEANTKLGNADNDGSDYYTKNCQCCVYAHELRRRGFDITAKGNRGGDFFEDLEVNTERGWLTTKMKTPEKTPIKSDKWDINELVQKIQNNVSNGGRYTLEWDYNKDKGHIVCMEVIEKQLVIYDAQNGDFLSLRDIVQSALPNTIQMLRVDRLLVNLGDIDKIVTKR